MRNHRSVIDLPPDPVTLREKERATQQHANFCKDAQLGSSKGRKGKILSVDSNNYSYQVNMQDTGETKTLGRLLTDYSDATLLPTGADVAVATFGEIEVIVGVLPLSASEDSGLTPRVCGDATLEDLQTQDPVSSQISFRLPHQPTNLLPQDKVMVSPSGNYVGALGGGTNSMRSGMAEVRTHIVDDLVEVIGRHFRHISDMGMSEIKNNNGKVTWTFRGGTRQLIESGSDQENWSIRINLGEDEHLFNFALTSPAGIDLFRLSVDNDGELHIYAADGITQQTGKNWFEEALGNHDVRVYGSETAQVGGQQTSTVNGNRTATVSGSETKVIGNDLTETAVRHKTESVGGNHLEVITGGNPIAATPLNIARKTRVINGSWEIDIGDVLSGANLAAKPSYRVKVPLTGEIILGAYPPASAPIPTAQLSLNPTLAPSTATLVGTKVSFQQSPVIPAIDPVILGLRHKLAFDTFINTVRGACTTAGSASVPSVPVDGSVMQAFTAAFQAALAALETGIAGSLSTVVFTA